MTNRFNIIINFVGRNWYHYTIRRKSKIPKNKIRADDSRVFWVTWVDEKTSVVSLSAHSKYIPDIALFAFCRIIQLVPRNASRKMKSQAMGLIVLSTLPPESRRKRPGPIDFGSLQFVCGLFHETITSIVRASEWNGSRDFNQQRIVFHKTQESRWYSSCRRARNLTDTLSRERSWCSMEIKSAKVDLCDDQWDVRNASALSEECGNVSKFISMKINNSANFTSEKQLATDTASNMNRCSLSSPSASFLLDGALLAILSMKM